MAPFGVVDHEMYSGVRGKFVLKEQIVLIRCPAYLYQETGRSLLSYICDLRCVSLSTSSEKRLCAPT